MERSFSMADNDGIVDKCSKCVRFCVDRLRLDSFDETPNCYLLVAFGCSSFMKMHSMMEEIALFLLRLDMN